MAIEGVSIAFDDPALEPDPEWTRLDATDNLVASYSIRRGRQDELERTGTGTASIEINDTAGVFDPTLVSGIDGRQAAIALHNPITDAWKTLFRGFTDAYDYELEPSGVVTRVQIELVDGLDYLAGVEVAEGTAGDPLPADGSIEPGNVFYLGTEVDTRIHQALSNATLEPGATVSDGWPPDLRTIFSGNVIVLPSTYPPGSSILQIIQDAADAEFPGVANIYCSKLGKVTFHGRYARFHPDSTAASAGAAWDFHRWHVGDGSAPDVGTAQLRALSFTRPRKNIINAAMAYPEGIADANIAGQIVFDTGSIAQYGVHSWSAENLLIYSHKTNGNTGRQETLLMAQYYVENYAEPQNRITNMVFRSISPSHVRAAATWNLLCNVEVSDIVHLTTSHAGGGGFEDEEYYVEGISYEVRPLQPNYQDVTLSLDVSPVSYYSSDPFDDVAP